MTDEATFRLDVSRRANRDAIRHLLDALDAADTEPRSHEGAACPLPASGNTGRGLSAPVLSEFRESGPEVRREPDTRPGQDVSSLNLAEPSGSVLSPAVVGASSPHPTPRLPEGASSTAEAGPEPEAPIPGATPDTDPRDDEQEPAAVRTEDAPVERRTTRHGQPETRPWTDEDKRRAFDMAQDDAGIDDIAVALGRPYSQVKVFLWNARKGNVVVPAPAAAEVDMAALAARVAAGERIKDVARSAGINGHDLQRAVLSKPKAPRIRTPKVADDGIDWAPLVQRVVEGGEACADVAREAGVSVHRLGGKVVYAKHHAAREADAPVPTDPQNPEMGIPITQVATPEPDPVEPEAADAPPTEPNFDNLCGLVEMGARTIAQAAAEGGISVDAMRSRLDRRRAKRATEAAEAARQARWTVEMDLRLVEAVCAGPGGADRAAAALGISREDVLGRWSELLPVKGLAEQSALLMRLRKQAAPVAAE